MAYNVMLKGYSVKGGVLASVDHADQIVATKEQVLHDLMQRGFVVVETGTPGGFFIGRRRGDALGLTPVGRVVVVAE